MKIFPIFVLPCKWELFALISSHYLIALHKGDIEIIIFLLSVFHAENKKSIRIFWGLKKRKRKSVCFSPMILWRLSHFVPGFTDTC